MGGIRSPPKRSYGQSFSRSFLSPPTRPYAAAARAAAHRHSPLNASRQTSYSGEPISNTDGQQGRGCALQAQILLRPMQYRLVFMPASLAGTRTKHSKCGSAFCMQACLLTHGILACYHTDCARDLLCTSESKSQCYMQSKMHALVAGG